MAVRITKETLCLRHNFTTKEQLEMGSELAQAHNRLLDIEEEEKVMKAQIKEKKESVDSKIGSLSRALGTGFEMRNIDCDLEYDKPNVGEVTYRRRDNKLFVKARAMTEAERQMDLPLDTAAQVEESIAKSAENIADHFGPGLPTEQPTAETAGPIPLEESAPAAAPEVATESTQEPSEIYREAIDLLRAKGKVGASALQKSLVIGYTAAAHILDRMKSEGLIDENGKAIPKTEPTVKTEEPAKPAAKGSEPKKPGDWF